MIEQLVRLGRSGIATVERLGRGHLLLAQMLAGGGDLGDVDLIYVPEPATAALGLLALTLLSMVVRRPRRI